MEGRSGQMTRISGTLSPPPPDDHVIKEPMQSH